MRQVTGVFALPAVGGVVEQAYLAAVIVGVVAVGKTLVATIDHAEAGLADGTGMGQAAGITAHATVVGISE